MLHESSKGRGREKTEIKGLGSALLHISLNASQRLGDFEHGEKNLCVIQDYALKSSKYLELLLNGISKGEQDRLSSTLFILHASDTIGVPGHGRGSATVSQHKYKCKLRMMWNCYLD